MLLGFEKTLAANIRDVDGAIEAARQALDQDQADVLDAAQKGVEAALRAVKDAIAQVAANSDLVQDEKGALLKKLDLSTKEADLENLSSDIVAKQSSVAAKPASSRIETRTRAVPAEEVKAMVKKAYGHERLLSEIRSKEQALTDEERALIPAAEARMVELLGPRYKNVNTENS